MTRERALAAARRAVEAQPRPAAAARGYQAVTGRKTLEDRLERRIRAHPLERVGTKRIGRLGHRRRGQLKRPGMGTQHALEHRLGAARLPHTRQPGHPRRLRDAPGAQMRIARHALDPCLAHRQPLGVAAQQRRAHRHRRGRQLERVVEPAPEGGIDLLDLVAHPDRRHRVGLEQTVHPRLLLPRAAFDPEEGVGDLRKGVFDLVEEDEAAPVAREQALSEAVGIKPLAPGARAAVGVLGGDHVEFQAQRLGQGAGKGALAGAGPTVEKDVDPGRHLRHRRPEQGGQQRGVFGQVRKVGHRVFAASLGRT